MGLVGENGAGKSTLVKIVSGFDDGYTGTYEYQGRETRFRSPGIAEQAGIAIAQQELSLIPAMSVAENIFLAGHNVHAVATKRSLAAKARRFLDEVGLNDVDPTVRVDRLSIGEQHLVEVARLIAHDPKVLILDEPTAALGEADSIRILDMVGKLAAAGKSIIYVSHRLDEIFKITDRIIVLRDGESQRPRRAAELNVNSLVELMLGRKLENMFPERTADHKRELLLSVRDLWPDGMLEPVSFDVYSGEILGLAGQLGSGTGEILAAMAGSCKTRSGKIDFAGETFLPRNPAAAIRRKLGYCSDDRKYDGLFLGRPIRENLTSPALETVSRFGWNFGGREQTAARSLAEKFTVDVSRLGAEAGVLSGGNQQKVALGKWLAISPKVILVNEPTRGVDVGAKAEIYQKMRDLADEGAAIVFTSTDMQEVTYLPDRIITFYRGMKIGGFDLAGITTAGILKEITDPFNETNL
ncbi:MAG: sugar ABC transporter ATP-binding protein [Hyphomicrobiales bacterium]|nr:sugar ABC transporter ATP-binding protein [Hyphomicrobiales bacterium]